MFFQVSNLKKIAKIFPYISSLEEYIQKTINTEFEGQRVCTLKMLK